MTLTTPPRPGLRAFDDALRLTDAALVAEVRGVLGAKLVAYLARVKETRAVRQWAEGEREVRPDVSARLRVAYQASALILERDEARVVQAWFQGLNPQLDDQSPASLLRSQDLAEVGPAVLSAARSFAATG